MPLDSLDFAQNPLLAKLGRVERLLANEQQWCKGRLRDIDGRHCLVGAIEAAGAWHETARIVLRATREVSGRRYWRIESRTTHADVRSVLCRARQDIIDQMADQCDAQPRHRKWLQAIRRLYPGRPAAGGPASAPHLVGSLDDQPKLGELLGHGQRVAVDGR